MSNSHEEDREVEELMRVVPMSQETPVELKSRLQTLAGMTRVRRPAVWPMRLAMAGVAVVAVAGITLTMIPTSAEAKTYAKVMQAADKIDQVELTILSNEDGGKHSVVIAGGKDRFVMRADRTLIQIDGESFKTYDPKKNEITEMKWPKGINLKDFANEAPGDVSKALADLDLKQKLADYEKEYGKDNIQISPITHRFGKSLYEVTMQKPGDPERVHLIVNADNDLPEHIDVSKQNGNEWKEDVVMDLRYGHEVSLDLEFPANAKKVQIDLGAMMEGFKGIDLKGLDLKGLDFKGMDFTDKKPEK